MGKMDFSFITDESLRVMLERDSIELNECFNHGICKSTLILAGSIIEAMLVDYFITFPPTGKTADQIMKADLSDLIDWASDTQISLISDTTNSIATVVRHYRNLIHPGVELRKQISIDQHKASVSVSLVNLIVEEIKENYLKKLGYSADQAIKKIENDVNCSTIFDQIIKNMSAIERKKLYILIPQVAYKDCYVTDNKRSSDQQLLKSFLELHNLLRDEVGLEVRKSNFQDVYQLIIGEGSVTQILFYLRFFIDEIDLLDDEPKKAVINYVIGILENNRDNYFDELDKSNLGEIGKYLNDEVGARRICNILISDIFNKRCESEWDEFQTDPHFLNIIVNLLLNIDYYKIHEYILKELSKYKDNARARKIINFINSNIIAF